MARSGSKPVHLSFHLSRAVVDHPDGTRLIVMVRLRADRDPDFKRAPMNLSFVLDRSGSMAGDKLQQCKHAVTYAVSHLTDQDSSSIVLFDDRVEVLVTHDRVVSKDRLVQALAPVVTRGSTNLSAGWEQGGRFVEAATGPGIVSRILLLTDGQANTGVTQPTQLYAMARDLLQKGVQTTTIGFGSGFNEELLGGMANAGGGNFHYVETADQAPTIFAREFDELLRVVAQNLRLTVSPVEPVQFLGSLNDFPSQTIPEGTCITLGDLCAGDEKNLLLEFCIPSGEAGRDVARLKLNYQQVTGDVSLQQVSTTVKLPKKGVSEVSIDSSVYREVLLAEVAREMLEARKEADGGNLDTARNRIDKAREKLEASDYSTDPTFKEQAAQLARIRSQMVDRAVYTSTGSKSLSYGSVSLFRQKSYTQGGLLDPDIRQKLLGARTVAFVLTGNLTRRPPWPPRPETPRDQARLWRWVQSYRTAESPESRALAAFAHRWPRTELITTNSGDLGSVVGMKVLELGGSVRRACCVQDERRYALPDGVEWRDGLAFGECGHELVLDTDWGGAPQPESRWHDAVTLLHDSDVVIVLGPLSLDKSKPLLGALVQNKFKGAESVIAIEEGSQRTLHASHRLLMPVLAGLQTLATETSTVIPDS